MGRSEIAAITPAKQRTTYASHWIFASMLACLFGAIGAQIPLSTTDDKHLPSLAYDVATIRESGPDANGSLIMSVENPSHVARLKSQNQTANQLINLAYGVASYQLAGGTEWSQQTPLIIQAQSDDATTEVLAKLSDKDAKLAKQHMLQKLLADRFQLKVHWTTKVMPIHALTLAKSGPKLERSDPTRDAREGPWPRQSCLSDGCHIVARNVPLTNLASLLTGQCGTEVQDKTGLAGAYNFKTCLVRYAQRPPPRGSLRPPVTLSAHSPPRPARSQARSRQRSREGSCDRLYRQTLAQLTQHT